MSSLMTQLNLFTSPENEALLSAMVSALDLSECFELDRLVLSMIFKRVLKITQDLNLFKALNFV